MQSLFCYVSPSSVRTSSLWAPRTSFCPAHPSRTLYLTTSTPRSTTAGLPGSIRMAIGVRSPEDASTEVATDIGYELRDTAEKGEGVYATKAFQPGDTVLVGFILEEVSQNHSHATQISKDRWVQHGGLNSKLNHSCDPNCGVRLNETGACDFVARQSIEVGEELTFDYAMRNYVIEHFPKRCACGAKDCRVTITGYTDLPVEFKKRYAGFIAPYLLEIDQENQEGST